MSWNDKNMIATSSGGGGVDLPVGTIAYFPDGVGQENWLEAGQYLTATYPDLADLPGYPILDTIQTINDTVSTTVPFNTNADNILALPSQSGDKIVMVSDTGYVELTQNDPSGLVEVPGNYFSTGSINIFNLTQHVSLSKSTGLCYCVQGSPFAQDIYSLDITAKTYQIAWSSSVIGHPTSLYFSNYTGGSQFDFTDDNRLVAFLGDTTDGLYLWISEPDDWDTGDFIPCTLPIDRTASMGSFMKGVGVSGDKVVFGFLDANGCIFYQYDRTNLVWTDITTNTSLPTGSGTDVQPSVSGHSMSDGTIALSTWDDNVINVTALKAGNIFTPVETFVDPNTSVDFRGVLPITNGHNMWYIANTSSSTTPRISYDDLDSFQQLSSGDSSEFACVGYAPQIENIAFGSDTTTNEATFYNSLTLQTGTEFLVPVIREVTASSNPVHLAKVNA